MALDPDKISILEAAIKDLEAAGCDEKILAPIRTELQNLRIADLEAQLTALKESCDIPPSPTPASPPPPTPLPPAPPPPASPPPASTSDSPRLSVDEQILIERLYDLCFDIDTASNCVPSDAAASEGARQQQFKVQALRMERKTIFGQLRESDAVLYAQTLEVLQASFDIPTSDLPAQTKPEDSVPPVSAAPLPSPLPPPPPPAADSAPDDTAAEEESVVVIGGKRYVLKPPPPPPPPEPSPPTPSTKLFEEFRKLVNPFESSRPVRPPSPPPPPPQPPPQTAEQRAAAEVAAAEAAAQAEARRAAREAEMAEAARRRAEEAAAKAEAMKVEAAENRLEMAGRAVNARRDLSSLQSLDQAIELAASEAIVRPEALAAARAALATAASQTGFQRRLDELRKSRPPPPPPPPPPPAPATAPAPPIAAAAEAAVQPAAGSASAATLAAAEQRRREVEAEEKVAEEAAAARKEAAAEAAEAAEAVKATAAAEAEMAQKAATRAAEMEACQAEIMGSLKLSVEERRQLLRRIQVRWHPDNFPGDDPAAIEAREFANVVARIANDAASQAKKKRAKAIRAKKRNDAYEGLQAAMPSFLGGLMGGPTNAKALRTAIEVAKEAGISLVDIRDAEEALRKLESKETGK